MKGTFQRPCLARRRKWTGRLSGTGGKMHTVAARPEMTLYLITRPPRLRLRVCDDEGAQFANKKDRSGGDDEALGRGDTAGLRKSFRDRGRGDGGDVEIAG